MTPFKNLYIIIARLDNEEKVLFYCTKMVELFRFAELKKFTDENCELWQYKQGVAGTRHLSWNKEQMTYKLNGSGISIFRTTFKELEKTYKLLKRLGK